MKIGISCCSNGQEPEYRYLIDETCSWLEGLGFQTVQAEHIYVKEGHMASGTGEERAEDLMKLYRDPDIGMIFDISGGDIANEVLPYLDFDVIAKANKTFWGYSDLSTIINSIYAMTGKSSVLFQAKHLAREFRQLQRQRVKDLLVNNNGSLFDIDYEFVRGDHMEGIVIGGNIRCLLKLAGTRFWPEMQDKVLFLEALGGEEGAVRALFSQLEQLDVFDKVKGVLLGTFTKYEESNPRCPVQELLYEHIPDSLPVAVTREVGHAYDSKALEIGKWRSF